jgi:MYXO-CTERM domain-containing protein
MLVSARESGELAADACEDFSCGDNGTCMEVGGFATCACEDGYAASVMGAGLECSRVKRTFGPEQLLWNTSGCSGCSATGGSGAGGAALALLLLPILGLRRRSSRV